MAVQARWIACPLLIAPAIGVVVGRALANGWGIPSTGRMENNRPSLTRKPQRGPIHHERSFLLSVSAGRVVVVGFCRHVAKQADRIPSDSQSHRAQYSTVALAFQGRNQENREKTRTIIAASAQIGGWRLSDSPH